MIRISIVAVSLGLSLAPLIHAEEPAEKTPVNPERIHKTVKRAVAYLQTESDSWLKTRKCAACHHVPLPLWALSEAERQGYPIDKQFVTDTVESLLGSEENLKSSRIFPDPDSPPDPRPQGRGLNMGLPFLAVAAHSLPNLTDNQKQTLKLVTEEIVKKQQPDGSWEFFSGLRRPPINETQLTDAAWIIMALREATNPDAPESVRASLAKADTWREGAKPAGIHQEQVFKLWLGIHAGKTREELQTTIDDLLALQRADGGWSQTIPEPVSDAYATGQTLYVLSLAGHTADHPQLNRAIDFLVATQTEDGSWPMLSRSTPDGSEGSSKLLSPIVCAAASWATLGLTRLVPHTK